MAAADVDGIAEEQALAAGGAQDLVLNGDLVSASVAVMDVARHISVTSAGNDAGITFTIEGTDRYGNPLVEVIQGADSGPATTTANFRTVSRVTGSGDTDSTVEAGTAASAETAWIPLDHYAHIFNVHVIAEMQDDGESADFTYGLQYTLSGVQAEGFQEHEAVVVDHADMTAETADASDTIATPVSAVRMAISAYATGILAYQVAQQGGPVS